MLESGHLRSSSVVRPLCRHHRWILPVLRCVVVFVSSTSIFVRTRSLREGTCLESEDIFSGLQRADGFQSLSDTCR